MATLSIKSSTDYQDEVASPVNRFHTDVLDREPDHDPLPETLDSPWSALLSFTTRSHLPSLVLGLIAAVACGVAGPAQSVLIGKAFGVFSDYKIGKISGPELLSHETRYVLYLVAVAVGSWVVHTIFFTCWLAFGELQAKTARDRLLRGLLRGEQSWYDTREVGIGALISRCHQQVRELQLATSQPLGSLISIAAEVCSSFGLAMFYSWKLTLVIISTLPVMLLLLAWLGAKMQSHVVAQHDCLATAVKNLSNAIEAIDMVKCYVAETLESMRYMRAINQAARSYLKTVNINGQQAGLTQFIGQAMFVQGFYYGGVLIDKGEKSTADVVTTFLAAMGAFGQLSGVIGFLLPMEKGRAAGVAIRAVIRDAEASSAAPRNSVRIDEGPCRGEIELRQVCFTYPTRPDSRALANVSFRVPAGRTTFVLGQSGSGKSTIAQLLLGFYKLDSGSIMIDGRDIREYDPQWLRRNISLVEQSGSLFDMSMGENIALGKPSPLAATEPDIIAAAEFAQLQALVWDSPGGLDTTCGPNGNMLSGGQRQRVMIARARLRDTPVLIMDEPTSALDPTTRTRVMDAIRTWRRGKTTIIITHDHLLLRPDDVKINLEQGQIIEPARKQNIMRSATGHTHYSRGESSRTSTRQSLLANGDMAIRRRSRFIPSMFGGANNVFGSAFLQPIAPPRWTANQLMSPRDVSGDVSASATTRRRSSVYSTKDIADDVKSKRGSMAALRALFAEPTASRPSKQDPHVLESQGVEMSDLSTSGFEKATIDTTTGEREPRNNHSRHEAPVKQNPKLLSLRSILSTVWPNLDRKHRYLLLLAFALCTLHAAVTPIFAFVLGNLINTFGTGPKDHHKALVNAMLIIVLAAADGAFVYGMHVVFERCGQQWVDALRLKAVTRILAQPKQFFASNEASVSVNGEANDGDQVPRQNDTTSSHSLVECLDRNAEEMRNLLGRFASLAVVGSTMVGISLLWSLVIQWKITLLALCTAPYVYAVTRVFGSVNAHWEQKCTNAAAVAAKVTNTVVGAIKTVRGCCLETYFSEKHARATDGAFAVGLRRAVITGFFFGQTEACAIFVQTLVFYIGARVVSAGDRGRVGQDGVNMNSVSVDAVVQVFLLMIMTTTNIGNMLSFVPQINQSRDAASRFLRLTELPKTSFEHLGRLSVRSIERIQFSGVEFKYPGPESEDNDNTNGKEDGMTLAMSTNPAKHAAGKGRARLDDKSGHALRDVTFFIEPGTSTAIVGGSGSGKSTILALLLKLYRLDQAGIRPDTFPNRAARGTSLHGSHANRRDRVARRKGIFLDNHPIDRIDTTFLRQRIAVVAQTPRLLPGTIAENITYGLPYRMAMSGSSVSTDQPQSQLQQQQATTTTPTTIETAARRAGIHEFVKSLPEGYATRIGDGGTCLSGGQAQRIAIARALIREPRVLILDEATSALDPVGAARIIRGVVAELVETTGLTVIAVTHSREMMEAVDTVLVLDRGRVVQKGPFEELSKMPEGPLCTLLGNGVMR